MEILRRLVGFVRRRKPRHEDDSRTQLLQTDPTDRNAENALRADGEKPPCVDLRLPSSPLVPFVEASQAHGLTLWSLPYDFSQSRLGGRPTPSTACTLISMKLVESLGNEQVDFPHLRGIFTLGKPCPPSLLIMMLNAIVDGNVLHEKAMMKRRKRSPFTNYDCFTVPQAIRACDNHVMEIDYTSCSNALLRDFLTDAVRMVLNSTVVAECSRIYMALVAFGRTTTLVFDRPTRGFFFFDSHSHKEHGALICYSDHKDFHKLVVFIAAVIYPESLRPTGKNQFEVSVLHNIRKCGEKKSDVLMRHLKLTLHPQKIFPKKSINAG
ncbi:hypothetical protein QR680_005830 [Steinernema hermaphroditum]|uniref:Uncharacterized protein n=1 Tax=Steinernema hermaphroditum TaxID=289476 RepID=A0AA39HUK1_9BILA|nr:hypothetical protein QR680_005830 [Steinernema hermaphroditum]